MNPIVRANRLRKKVQRITGELKIYNRKLIEFTLESQTLPQYISVYRELFQF